MAEIGLAPEDGSRVGEIESGVPIPTRRGRKRGAVADNVSRLAIGDSFVVHAEGHISTAWWNARKLGIVLMARSVDGGWRIWRKA